MSFISQDNSGWYFGLAICFFLIPFYNIPLLAGLGIIIVTKSITEIVLEISKVKA